ncbi:MAG: DUF3084 domain-containing protein [Chloroflexaceae bacterium]|nr:DUF3084 domain-containing protein [Chloroflexaceae bacterium]
MTSAYILIAAILVLGGAIAALGDNLGTKVGKARLRLFKLRPRQTATVMTIFTGVLISSSTLGILFGLSESLRKGVFELDDILRDLRQSKGELEQLRQEKAQVEAELSTAKNQENQVLDRLETTNQNFQKTQTQLQRISQQAQRLRADIATLLQERDKLQQQQQQLKTQSQQLQSQVGQQQQQLQAQADQIQSQDRILAQKEQQLQDRQARLQSLEQQRQRLQEEIIQRDEAISELDTKIAQLDDQIAQLDRAIANKDQQLQVRQIRFEVLESQLEFLRREVSVLEQYYQDYQELRAKRIALVRGQVLAFATVQVREQEVANRVVDVLLQRANQAAALAMNPDEPAPTPQKQLVKITHAEVEQLLAQLKDGQDYVVRIVSAGNYVQGEQEVRVFADISPNEVIFKAGQEVATVSIDPATMSREDIQQRLDLLLASSQFRARRAGMLGEIAIGDGRRTTLLDFLEQLNQPNQPLEELQAIADETTYASGPLRLRLVAVHNGKIVFRS